jgi:uncharacterized protein (DUF433 family)
VLPAGVGSIRFFPRDLTRRFKFFVVDPQLHSQRCRDQISMLCLAPEGHMDFAKHFQRDPGVCGGEIVITGTRVTLRTVLASLTEGSSFDEILKDYPSLSEDQLRAVVAFAAATAKEDLPLLPLPTLE